MIFPKLAFGFACWRRSRAALSRPTTGASRRRSPGSAWRQSGARSCPGARVIIPSAHAPQPLLNCGRSPLWPMRGDFSLCQMQRCTGSAPKTERLGFPPRLQAPSGRRGHSRDRRLEGAVLQEWLGRSAVEGGYEISSDLTLESCRILSVGFSTAAPIRVITAIASRTRLKPTPAACSAPL
jgi:hypothetical protein